MLKDVVVVVVVVAVAVDVALVNGTNDRSPDKGNDITASLLFDGFVFFLIPSTIGIVRMVLMVVVVPNEET